MEKKNILCSREVLLNERKFVWLITTHSEYLVPVHILTNHTKTRYLKAYQISEQITSALFLSKKSRAPSAE